MRYSKRAIFPLYALALHVLIFYGNVFIKWVNCSIKIMIKIFIATPCFCVLLFFFRMILEKKIVKCNKIIFNKCFLKNQFIWRRLLSFFFKCYVICHDHLLIKLKAYSLNLLPTQIKINIYTSNRFFLNEIKIFLKLVHNQWDRSIYHEISKWESR